jgi:hypothetical protein
MILICFTTGFRTLGTCFPRKSFQMEVTRNLIPNWKAPSLPFLHRGPCLPIAPISTRKHCFVGTSGLRGAVNLVTPYPRSLLNDKQVSFSAVRGSIGIHACWTSLYGLHRILQHICNIANDGKLGNDDEVSLSRPFSVSHLLKP